MRKIAKIYLFVVIGLVISSLTSCISGNKGFQSSPVVARDVQLDPIKADINVDTKKKLKGVSSSTYFLIFRVLGDNKIADGIDYSSETGASLFQSLNPFRALRIGRLSKVRGAAAYNAMDGKDYDVLVHPSYTITTKNYFLFQLYEVEVTGYGATYENFRTERQKVVITNNTEEYVFPEE